ncbi:MAG: T9SS type A sorting domain-containing protein [Candidatus Cloacimonetes bacterium]|nr:T9SS type A sorting domain-containing protein [Candidatus Cloacimonadota bacterium]
MKKYIFLLVVLFIFIQINCFSSDVNFEKMGEYPTSGYYCEKDNQAAIYPYLYFANQYGLEIYELDASDDVVDLISRLPLYGDSRSINIKNNFAYVITISSSENYYQIYQIDICNPEAPTIINEITFYGEENFAKGYIFGDYFITKYDDNQYNNYLKIIKIPELQYMDDYQYSGAPFIKLNDSTAIKYNNNNLYTLYDFSDPTNITELNQVNLPGTDLDNPSNFKLLNDTLVVAVSNDGLSFWNITDLFNWNLISMLAAPPNTWWCENVCYNGTDLIFIPHITNYTGVTSIHIADITNPYIVDSIYINPPYYFISLGDMSLIGNSIFLGTWHKINQLTHTLGYFNNKEEIYSNYHTNNGNIYNNYFYLVFDYGLGIYDITYPQNMVRVNTLLDNNCLSSAIVKDNMLALIDYGEDKIKIFSLSDAVNPTLRNEITISYAVSADEILFNNDENIYYVSEYPNPELKKYDISQPGVSTLEFSYDLGTGGNGFIYNDHLYYLAEYDNSYDLKIIGGITEDDPELILTIEEFVQNFHFPNMFNIGNKFYIYDTSSYNPSLPRFYQINDTIDIEYMFSTNQHCGGRFFIDNNKIYISGYYSNLYVYNLTNIDCDTIDPIQEYEDFGSSVECLLFEHDNKDYLYHIQRTAVSVYEIEENGVNTQPSNKNIYLTSHPNPFTNSTSISFTSKTPINENQQIKIFNIKGQKVRSLSLRKSENTENGMLQYSATWDGKNENKQKVAPGIYFSKIESEEKTYVNKMLLMK